MNLDYSNYLSSLPQYPFADMERIIREKRQKGEEIFPFNIGDPDIPTPDFVLDAVKEAVADARFSGYSSSEGELWFREAVSEWYSKRFGIQLDPHTQICALIGSKEGLVNITRVVANPGDRILYPDPGYPAYRNGAAALAGFTPVSYELYGENYQPRLEEDAVSNSKVIFVNYPHNPTGAVVDEVLLRRVIELGRKENVLICYDNAYSEITFDGYNAPSLLQFSKDYEGLVELHSCSKTFSMTGFRIGFAVGDERIISGLVKLKSQIDSGPPKFIQYAAKKALESYTGSNKPRFVRDMIDIYHKRLKLLVAALREQGSKVQLPQATFYLWQKVSQQSSMVARNLAKVGILVTPGTAFGSSGTNFIRWSVTLETKLIEKATEYMRKYGIILG